MSGYSTALHILVVIGLFLGAQCSGWSYDNAEAWPGVCQSGYNQSPVVLSPAAAMSMPYSPLEHVSKPLDWTLSNDGHSAKAAVSECDIGSLSISGGGLPDTYEVLQLHFHWGSNNYTGSEHLLSNGAFPLEMHVVSRRNGTNSTTMLLDQSGLASFGFWFELGDHNPIFQQIVNHLHEIVDEGAETKLPAFDVADLCDAVDESRFFRYDGSLTTPTCDEAVLWTVFEEPLVIDAEQLAALGDLQHESEGGYIQTLADNFRPTQPLNGRTVYKSWNEDDDDDDDDDDDQCSGDCDSDDLDDDDLPQ